MDYLPDDILTQILVKVQCSRSILRCTSVCKPWYSLINSPAFINFDLLHCPDKPKYLLFDYNPTSGLAATYDYGISRYLSIHHDTETLVEHDRLVCFYKPGSALSMSIHGCCNGLICYSLRGLTYLWNPTIRKQKALPRNRDRGNAYGFWFDKRVNDYMVAKINEGLSYSVYSLRTNSWKTISAEIPYNLAGSILRELAYVDGTLHWPALTTSGWMIFSLDIESGLLRKTMITETMRSDIFFFLQPLGEHSFALVQSKIASWYEGMSYGTAHVYDHNVNKLYTIDLEKDTHHKLHHMVGLRNNGEALFTKLDQFDSGFISWNTKTKEFKEFIPDMTATGKPESFYQHVNRIVNCRLSRVRPFVETLVLLNDRDAKRFSTENHHPACELKKCSIWLVLLAIFFLIMFSIYVSRKLQ